MAQLLTTCWGDTLADYDEDENPDEKKFFFN
jgi:hypothetical protein